MKHKKTVANIFQWIVGQAGIDKGYLQNILFDVQADAKGKKIFRSQELNWKRGTVIYIGHFTFKPRCWKPPGHYLYTPEPGRLGCVISIQKDMNATSAGKRLIR